MKVTYSWLKDFVEIKIPPKALAEKLTMAGLEVTSLEEKENDFVFEIEVTSNRPDCLSVIGVAREVAAITNSKFNPAKGGTKLQRKSKNFKKVNQTLKIEIENKRDCPLYTAKIIKDVKVGTSPDWLKRRLELVGLRSVNNIVDISNYILFELGEPLHAFDWDKLNTDTIIVRRSKKDERLATIDGQQRILNPDILVIANKEKPVAIAGVMGGIDTEVRDSTKNILLEAAIFNPVLIRHSRQLLGLQSESAYRFERGIDLEVVEEASGRAATLILSLAKGDFVLAKSQGKASMGKQIIQLDLFQLNKILMTDIKANRIKKILSNLRFKIQSKTKNIFVVKTPSFRQDILSSVDLIEEVARIFGYDRIPASIPTIKPQPVTFGTRDLVPQVKNIMVGLGLNEVVTYSLIDRDLLKALEIENVASVIEISNPLSREQEILRPSIIPSLIKCVALNLNQKQSSVNIFEVAKVFSNTFNETKEELVLGIALCSLKSLETGFLNLKGICEVLCSRLGVENFNFNTTDEPAEAALYINKEKIGKIAMFKKETLERLDIKHKDVLAAELMLDKLLSFSNLQKRFAPLPIYPGISRDISFILKETVRADEILKTIRERGRPLLQEVNIVDYYKGKQIPAGFRSLTISCLYRSNDKTLTEAEVNPAHSLICNLLVDRFGAKIRA